LRRPVETTTQTGHSMRGFRMPSATRNVTDNPRSRFSDANLRATIA
jgi:hypothetical protein